MFDDLKEKYAEFVESLEEKGVPRPQLLVPLALIVLVVAVVFLVNPFVQQAISSAKTGSVVVSVRDQAGSPLANAFVELVYSANGSSFAQAVAGGDGRASFSGVPLDGSVEVRASASGFQSKSVALSPEGETVVNLAVVSPEKKEREFRVKVKSSEGAPVEFAYVTLSFDDGSSTGVFTDASGYAQFSLDKNYSHATVKVEAPGFVSLEKSVGAADLSSGVAEFAAEPVAQATSSPEAVKKGTFKVVVFSAGVPVKGARVKLVDLAANEFGAGITGDDGVAAFPGIVFGKQFVVSVSADGFLDKQSQDYVTFSFDGQSEQVFLERKMSGSTSMVSLVVEDEQGNAVAGAEASFFFKDSNKLARKEVSGEDGRVAFEAVKGVQFYVTVYKQGFLPGFLEAVKAGDSKKMVLREEVAGSVATLSVKVLADGLPAANAEVALYREGGFFLGVPVFYADASGFASVVVPNQFNSAPYKVYAKAVSGTARGQSDLLELSPQTSEANLSLVLRSPPAALNLKVVDLATGKPVPGASTQLLVQGNPVDSCTTTQEGVCVFSVAANIPFSYAVKASGYLPFASSELSLESASSRNETASLYPLASGLRAQFLGLFNARGLVREAANGETYSAKFVVSVPSGSEQAGLYVRLGDKASAADEIAFISDYDKSAASVVYAGSSFDSSAQCPSETAGSGDELKWVLLVLPKGFVGTKEVSFTVVVRKQAGANDSINFAFRAFSVRNNTVFLFPSDAVAAQELLAKSQSNASLSTQDFCRAGTASASVPLTSQPLVCSEGGELCYKFFFESDGVASSSGFQATLGKEFVLRYELLSDYVIDSLSLSSDYLRVAGYSSQAARFADDEAPVVAAQPQKVAVNSRPGVKSVGSITLKPLRATQSGVLLISFSSPSSVVLPEVRLSFSVVGSNYFRVSVSPQSLRVGEKRKVTVSVLDKLGQPASDAVVSLFECEGEPFGGNEPSAVVGDGSSGAGEDGKYVFRASPVGVGVVGVRVSRDDSKTFEECLVPVTAQNFLVASPESLSFEGDSSKAEKQVVSLSSSLPASVRVSAAVDCFGEAKPVKVFPKTFTLREGVDSTVTVQVIENASSNAQCVVRFVGRVNPEVVAEVEVPVDVRVSCPSCPVVAEGKVVGPSSLPSAISLVVDPYYRRDSKTFAVSLEKDPVSCQVTGFRVDPYSQYNAQSAAFVGSGLNGLWGCQACGLGAGVGAFNCFNCALNAQMPMLCAQCSSAAYPAGSFYCTGCNSYAGGLAASAWYYGSSPLVQWGASGYFSMPLSQGGAVGVGGFYGTPFAQSFASNPAWGYPYNYNYPTSLSQLDTAAYEDAVVVEECTKDAITVTADYRGRQPLPGVGSLVVSLGGGQKRTIPVTVSAASVAVTGLGPFFTGMPVPASVPSYYQNNYACNIDSSYEFGPFEVSESEDFVFSKEIQYSCPYSFDLTKFSPALGSTVFADACRISGRVAGNTGRLSLNCVFPRSALARLSEGKNEVELAFDLSSAKAPGATLSGTVKFVFVKKHDADKDQRLKVKKLSDEVAVCDIVNGEEKQEHDKTPLIEIGSAAEISYHFPSGSTDKKLFLFDEAGNLVYGSAPESGIFQVTPEKFKPGRTYAWRMYYKLDGAEKTVDCKFKTPPGEAAEMPSDFEVPGGAEKFCDTPSMHPIRNIVVFNEAQGHKVVRQSQPQTHFSTPSTPASVAVCIRTDSPEAGKPKVVFAPESDDVAGKLGDSTAKYSSVKFNCTSLSLDGKKYAFCVSEIAPASDFGALQPGTFVAVVDASELVKSFPDGSPKNVGQYARRFYCNAWPLDKRARTTTEFYGLGAGTLLDSVVYASSRGVDVGFACQNQSQGNTASDRVKFLVGVPPSKTSAASGAKSKPSDSSEPGFTVVSQEGAAEVFFAGEEPGTASNPFELRLLQVRFEKDASARVSLVDSSGSSVVLATFSGVVANTVPFSNALNKVGKLKMEVTYNGKNFVYWANGAPKSVAFEKYEGKASYYKLVGSSAQEGRPASKTSFEANCAPVDAAKYGYTKVKCSFKASADGHDVEGNEVELPGGFKVRVYEVSNSPWYKDPYNWGTGQYGKAYFVVEKNGERLDCDDAWSLLGGGLKWKRGDLRLNKKDVQECFWGGWSSFNEYTPFVMLQYDGPGNSKVIDQAEGVTQINLTITTFFSDDEAWLSSQYKYQAPSAGGRQASFLSTRSDAVYKMSQGDLVRVWPGGYFVSYAGRKGSTYYFIVRDSKGVIEDCDTSIASIAGGALVVGGLVFVTGATAGLAGAPIAGVLVTAGGTVSEMGTVPFALALATGGTEWVAAGAAINGLFDNVAEDAELKQGQHCGVGSTTGVQIMPLKEYGDGSICVAVKKANTNLPFQASDFIDKCP